MTQAINIFDLKTGKIIKKTTSSVTLKGELSKIIEQLKNRIQDEIHGKDYFRDIVENFEPGKKPNIYCKDIAVFVKRDKKRPGRGSLGVSVLHPYMALETSTYYINGDKDKLLEYISKEEFLAELEKSVLDLSECLKSPG